MDRVAGMVDEWLWLAERAICQSASKNIALHLEGGLERKLRDPLEDDNWALVSDDSEQIHYEKRVSSLVHGWCGRNGG